MSSDWIIAALALVTIGGVLALTAFHFGVFLKDPQNIDAFKRVAEDRTSATTKQSSEGVNGRSLRQRLDQAPSIDDPLSGRSGASLGLVGVLYDAKWSTIRATLKGNDPKL